MTDDGAKPDEDKAAVVHPDAPQKEAVDPTLLDKALDLMKAAVRGNGAKPEDVTFDFFEGEVLKFEMFERFRIEPRVSEKLVHGKQNGEVVGSQQDARQKIQMQVQNVTANPDIKANTIEILKKRADLGFGLDDWFMQLDRLNKTFVAHEVCTVCSGSKTIHCLPCQGNGRTHCIKCHGSKEVICPACHGVKFINTTRGRDACIRCHGRGKIFCLACKQTGFITCRTCKGSGVAQCKNCSGTGWHSHMSLLEIRARSKFDFEDGSEDEDSKKEEKLPPELPPLLRNLRGATVTEKHAEIHIVETKEREEELNKSSEKDEYIIPYHVRLPWGDIGFLLNGAPVRGKLFGFNPALVHMPPILEKTALVGLKLLATAAQSKGNVAAKIREAARTRAVAEALVTVAQNNRRRTLDLMHKRYPFGFRPETLQTMVVNADKALRNVTRTTRIAGMFFGLVLSAALCWFYYAGPGHALAAPFLTSPVSRIQADVYLLFACGVITTLCIRFAASRSLQNAIGRHVPPEKRKKLMPKMSQSAWWGCLSGAMIYAAVTELSIFYGGATPPLWHGYLLGLLIGG